MSAAGMRLFDEQTIDGVQVMSDYGVSFETFSLVQETSARLSAENDALRAQAKELILEIGVRDGMINDLQARIVSLEGTVRDLREELDTQ